MNEVSSFNIFMEYENTKKSVFFSKSQIVPV